MGKRHEDLYCTDLIWKKSDGLKEGQEKRVGLQFLIDSSMQRKEGADLIFLQRTF